MDKQENKTGALNFTRDNYLWMIIGGLVIALGMLLLSGGENKNASIFDETLVYSARRITVAPIVILLGFGIEIFAILKRPKVKKDA